MAIRSVLFLVLALILCHFCFSESEKTKAEDEASSSIAQSVDSPASLLEVGTQGALSAAAAIQSQSQQKVEAEATSESEFFWRRRRRRRARKPHRHNRRPRPSPSGPVSPSSGSPGAQTDSQGMLVIEASPPHGGWTGHATHTNQWIFQLPWKVERARIEVQMHAHPHTNGDVIVTDTGGGQHTVASWRNNDWFLQWRAPPPASQCHSWMIDVRHGVIHTAGRYTVTMQYRFGPHGASIRAVKLRVRRAAPDPPRPGKPMPPVSAIGGWDLVLPSPPHRGWTGGITHDNGWLFHLPGDVGGAKLVIQAAASGHHPPDSHGVVTLVTPGGQHLHVAHWFHWSPWMTAQPIWYHFYRWQGPFSGVHNWEITLPPLALTRPGPYHVFFNYRGGAHALVIFDVRLFKQTMLPLAVQSPPQHHWLKFQHRPLPRNYAALAEPRPHIKLPDPEDDARLRSARRDTASVKPRVWPLVKEEMRSRRQLLAAKTYRDTFRNMISERNRIRKIRHASQRLERARRDMAIERAQRDLLGMTKAVSLESQLQLHSTTQEELKDFADMMMSRVRVKDEDEDEEM